VPAELLRARAGPAAPVAPPTPAGQPICGSGGRPC